MNIPLATKALVDLLRSVPTPKGYSSYEIVRRAIEFDNPPRIPYCMFYHPTRTDVFEVAFLGKFLDSNQSKTINGFYTDSWGVKYQVTGRWHDTAVEFPLADLKNLNDYKFPNVIPKGMLPLFKYTGKLAKRKKKYLIVPDMINFYEKMRALMGFEALMMAPYEQPNLLHELINTLTDMTIELISKYIKIGNYNGFMTWQDWGLQTRLQMSIKMFKEFYKPAYKRIIDHCHDNNLHYIWHSCGFILKLLPEMIDLGVDVVQMDQPRLMDHKQLMNVVGGKLCMWNCLDIQWSNQNHITEDDIRQELKEMIDMYIPSRGGFIFRNYPDPKDINIPKSRQQFINSEFLKLNQF